jgi:ABC-type multidrug transport system ATPase subunit
MLEQPEAIYKYIGVCPQFDVVYDDATVREHLLFYARLKGCPVDEESFRVQNIAERVELDGDAFNMKSTELSGGMRRRLSIGMSLMGNPAVWLLDEPTTGLDPDVRRTVWEIIQAEKHPDRATVITTHAMDECQELCSNIGIMNKGELLCIGSQLHLKARFGRSLNLLVTNKHQASEGKKVPDISAFVQDKLCPTAEHIRSTGRTHRYKLPLDGIKVSVIFSLMEQYKDELQISEWGLSHSTLEEVFINTVTKSDRALKHAENNSGEVQADVYVTLPE